MPEPKKKLKKNLNLFDVFAICTGAMFSSGFFLLPGYAAAQTGPSVVLAYLIAGILIIPAMLAQAELATAMPRAGGTYFFLDRSMGPMAGTIGGIGTWVALVLKSAFALIGMGAYLALVVDLPIQPLAVGLTVAFGALNIVGAKESSQLQRWLVVILLAVLGYVISLGVANSLGVDDWQRTWSDLGPFMLDGIGGLMATVGLVFVSYAGLTKIASVAEEVENPDRNIPLGMTLSLATATVIYCIGTAIMVWLLDPSDFRKDPTPVATLIDHIPALLPAGLGLGLVVAAAIAAFASTGNAGIMSASRYPLAMARDRLIPDTFKKIGRFETPTNGVLLTAATMLLCIIALDIASVAKLASAFQLIIFGLLNLAVIVMRESRIDFYQPGFRMPLYPGLPIAGLLIPVYLIAQMGPWPLLLSAMLVMASVGWFMFYAMPRVERSGAVFHVFRNLGERQSHRLSHELRQIVSEKGLHEEDPYEMLIEESEIIDLKGSQDFDDALHRASHLLARRIDLPANGLVQTFHEEIDHGLMPIANGVAIPHDRHGEVERSQLLIIRLAEPLRVEFDEDVAHVGTHGPVDTVMLLLSPDDSPGKHLRMLATLAAIVEEPEFRDLWEAAEDHDEVRKLLLDAD